MKIGTHLKSLYRSPLKTALTLLLLAAAAFLFLYNLSEYSVADREYREARDEYEGVLTVEEAAVPENSTVFDCFLMTDETGRTASYGAEYYDKETTYENYHQKSIQNELIDKLGALAYVSRVERRYLTAGVSKAYMRLDMDSHMFPYNARAVITATVTDRFPTPAIKLLDRMWPTHESQEWVTLENVELLAGDPIWLMDSTHTKFSDQFAIHVMIHKEEARGKLNVIYNVNPEHGGDRLNTFGFDNCLFPGDADVLQPGRRVLLVLRNDAEEHYVSAPVEEQEYYPSGLMHVFVVGDDTLIDWWPYFVDITDLPEDWLEQEEFADLRELIQVTNDDLHTFDVVYGDDMAAQRRVAEGRIVCEDGRFITPSDAGQSVCVVNTDVLDAYGLKVGDSITLDLGNYLSEQYAPLGAVASTRGRQNTEYTTQTFTIIGAWRDLNEGNHPFRDLFWCWSNNAIFVPSAFLPECRNAEGHEFKPSEVSFVVGNAEDIPAFVEECLPQVEAMGLTYVFSDGGWLLISKDLMRAKSLALVKLLIFSGAALFAMILTVWLFVGRKRREYGIFRALGMPKGEASNRLFVPFLLLGAVSTVLGFLAARIVTGVQLAASETTHVSADLTLFILGALGFLLLLAVMAFAGLLIVRRESILELVQEKQK